MGTRGKKQIFEENKETLKFYLRIILGANVSASLRASVPTQGSIVLSSVWWGRVVGVCDSQSSRRKLQLKIRERDFPGGPVAKTP